MHVAAQNLAKQNHPDHLDAAAGTASTGANKHQEQNDGLGKSRPQIEVRCCISGCGHDCRNRKGTMPDRF